MSESEPRGQYGALIGLHQEPVEHAPQSSNKVAEQLDAALSYGLQERLMTENYEDAAEALQEVTALRAWRQASRNSAFRDFYHLTEVVSAVAKAPGTTQEKAAMRQELADRLTRQAQHSSPRVADLYNALVAEISGDPYEPNPNFKTTEKLEQLRQSGDLDVLLSPHASYQLKLDRLQKRLEGYLKGSKALDRRDRRVQDPEEQEQRESVEQPTTPPSARNESKPSMDEMERSKEGEQPPAIWSITPGWGGYYKEQSFDTWDAERNCWVQSDYAYEKVTGFQSRLEEESEEGTIRLFASVQAGQWVRLPSSYTHEFWAIDDLNTRSNANAFVQRDKNGDYIFSFGGVPGKMVEAYVLLRKRQENESRTHLSPDASKKLNFRTQFSQETQQSIQDILQRKAGNLARARALASYTMRRLKYSNDSSFNAVYGSHPAGYIAAIDEHKQADCDVANTYFAALCDQAGIPVRHTVGHMVKGMERKNDGSTASRITSGTGHAWSEVWDDGANAWIRVDATPAGDPQLDDEEQAEGQESAPGDYGEQEAIGPTDTQIEELKQKLEELTEKLTYTQDERELAEVTGIEMQEARAIMREIQAAENTRLPNGERVVDVLSQLFALIVEARKTTAPDYSGPLRKREGGEEIDDIVAHKIGVLSGMSDPASRRKSTEMPREEQVFGGFDVHLVGDKSGSMSQTVEGEPKWQLQRRAEYLILSSLYRFEQNLERAKVRMADPLSVRTQALSFRGSGPDELDEDKALSSEFSPMDKVSLWKSLTTQGGGNGDVQALRYIYNEIVTELGGLDHEGQSPTADNRLRMVIACSDGYPDSVTGVHRIAEALGALNTVVVGVGLTETAEAVREIYDTPHSRGDIARDINDLPVIVAKHLVQEAVKLFPERSKQSVSRMIETIVAKFARVQ